MAKKAPGKANKKKAGNEPTLTQWKTLYETAKEIRKIEPWNFLWDTYLITVKLTQYKDPIYCSVMGKNGECYAIGLYYDQEAIASYNSIMNDYLEDVPFCTYAFEQKCLMCYFGDKDELYPNDKKVLKDLNINFRGKNEWIYFRALDPGYAPWYISSEQAEMLIQTLQSLIKALEYIIKEKPEIDFENQETLACIYSKDNKECNYKIEQLPVESFELPYLEFDNKPLFDNLKKEKKNLVKLEFEVTYLPFPIHEKKNDRPHMPKIILLMDRKSGIILDQYMAEENDGCELAIVEMLSVYIGNKGRPSAIYVRDYRTARYIEDFCNNTDIELVMGEGVPAIDNFLHGMLKKFSRSL